MAKSQASAYQKRLKLRRKRSGKSKNQRSPDFRKRDDQKIGRGSCYEVQSDRFRDQL